MITQNFNLNLIPDSAPVVVHVDQYDVGEGRFVIKLMNGDTPYTPVGATAVIQGMKPDGHGFIYAATISGNTVTADLVEQMSIVAGNVRCQLVITDADDRTGTFVFIIAVQKSALPADSDMSTSDYQLVEDLIITAESINTNPPKIGVNGNWWIWDISTMAYVDSGVDASITVAIADITMLSPDAAPYVTNTGTNTDPVFHLFIPRGQTGATGPAAGFGTPTASVDANVGTPSVDINASGPDTAKVFNFQFHNLKGATGDTGATGAAAGFGTITASVDANTGTPSVDVTASGPDTAKVLDFQFHNLKGADGSNTDPNAVHWGERKGYVGKNLLKNTAINKQHNGVDWVINQDKTITANNQATQNSVLTVGKIENFTGIVIVSGCPSGGTGSTYEIQLKIDGSWADYHEYGSGDLTISMTSAHYYEIVCIVRSGYTANNLTFSPMVRLATISDSAYEPYIEPNTEISNKLSYVDNGILGAKNLFRNISISKEDNGITWSRNNDGTWNANGLSTGYAYVNTSLRSDNNATTLKAGYAYKLYGAPEVVNSKISVTLTYTDNNGNAQTLRQKYPNPLIIPAENYDRKCTTQLAIESGTNVDNVTFKPVLCLASDTDEKYFGYTMTNEELTNKVQGIINAATNAADFAAFKVAISAL